MPTLTPGDGQDLLAAYKRAWERRDPEAAVALYAEDAEHREDPFEAPQVGAIAIRAMWNRRAATQANVEFDAERVWVVGATVLASYHAAHTERQTAQRVRRRAFMTLELNDQKRITRAREWPVTRAVGVDSTFDPEPGNDNEAANGQ
jgi:ketosteroid isomerase-like protein